MFSVPALPRQAEKRNEQSLTNEGEIMLKNIVYNSYTNEKGYCKILSIFIRKLCLKFLS